MKLTLVLMSLFLLSCAGINPQKTNHASLVRVSEYGSQTHSGMPNFVLPKWEQINPKLPAREPASIFRQEQRIHQKMSSKRLYFLTLLEQFKELSAISTQSSQITSCPHFHHDMVVMKEKKATRQQEILVIDYPSQGVEPQNWYLYPEFHLPLESDVFIMQVSEQQYFDPQRWQELMVHHHAKVKDELEVLCEYGKSDNFYIYVNYLRHLEKYPDFARTEQAFKSLLKIPIVANLYILRPMLSHGHEPKLSSLDQEALRRLKAQWLKGVLYNIAKHRYHKEGNQFVFKGLE